MSILGEIRLKASEAVRYLTVVYYNPNRARFQALYCQWPVRLAMCSMLCSLSYCYTFGFNDSFPYLYQLKQAIQNEDYKENVYKIYRQREVFLMAHVYVQRTVQQAESLVWLFSTFLGLKRRRFYFLATLVHVLQPLTSMFVQWCGNFALWLCIGQAMIRFFDLTPASHPRIGMVGCLTSLAVSTIFWKKFGILELFLACAVAVGSEVSWQQKIAYIQRKKQQQQQRGVENRPGILARIRDRILEYVASFFTAENDDSSTGKKKGTKNEKAKTAAEQTLPEYTNPSLHAWLAIVVYWAALGIKLGGYGLLKIF